jgi:hypothetical protein
MSEFAIKVVAVISMVVDHIGAASDGLLPTGLRVIGRLSFPLFAFAVSEGCKHTRNIENYICRLFIFALISEMPFDIAFKSNVSINFSNVTNVFYTLLLAVCCVYVYKCSYLNRDIRKIIVPTLFIPLVIFVNFLPPLWPNIYDHIGKIYLTAVAVFTLALCKISVKKQPSRSPSGSGIYDSFVDHLAANKGSRRRAALSFLKNNVAALFPICSFVFLGEVLNTDYGMGGICLILALYLVRGKIARFSIITFYVFNTYALPLVMYSARRSLNAALAVVVAEIAALIVCFYNGERGKNYKWVFYWLYPVHIIAIVLFFCIWRWVQI